MNQYVPLFEEFIHEGIIHNIFRAWISPDNIIHDVGIDFTHGEWMNIYYPELMGDRSFTLAEPYLYEKGWVRVNLNYVGNRDKTVSSITGIDWNRCAEAARLLKDQMRYVDMLIIEVYSPRVENKTFRMPSSIDRVDFMEWAGIGEFAKQ